MQDDDVIGSPGTWPVARKGGRLIKVEVAPGVYQKMHEEDAIALGLVEPEVEEKARRGARDKARRVAGSR